MNQPNLFQPAPDRVDLRPSNVRSVSRAAYTQLKESGKLNQRTREFLDALETYCGKYGVPPTVRELTRWAALTKRIEVDDPNTYRPRASQCVERGICEYVTKRPCRITHVTAAPIRIVSR